MPLRKIYFLLVMIAEISFALWSLYGPVQPVGRDVISYVADYIGDVKVFFFVMMICSFLSVYGYGHPGTFLKKTATAFSLAITVQWLMIAIGPLITGFYVVSLPLLFFMFFLRLLMSINIELESKADDLKI